MITRRASTRSPPAFIKGPAKDEPPGRYFDVMLRLEDRPALRTTLETYCTKAWLEWSETEKPRRRSIAVYQRLFEIAQRLLQSGGHESVELIWGLGVARWSRPEESIDLPMIERAVEIEIADQKDAAITIRPRATALASSFAPSKNLPLKDWLWPKTPPNAACARSRRPTARAFLHSALKPSNRFQDLRQSTRSRRTLSARFRASAPEPLPAERDILTVSDRYVLFARRRSANSVLRDIERFKEKLASGEPTPVVLKVPRARLSWVLRTASMTPTNLSATRSTRAEPTCLSKMSRSTRSGLIFSSPRPFNDDQVEIIRRLEKADGLVVQGPPGTGKTHTIANIICHMLATGRRVLVVSHGETALRVIRDQLPDGVRDLTISVATSEREGLKQVEKAIDLMLGIVNTVGANPQRQHALIMTLQAEIVRCRKQLAGIDAKIAAIATTHLSHIPGASETPYEAAQRVIADRPRFEWFADRPDCPFAETGISVATIVAASKARMRVGPRPRLPRRNTTELGRLATARYCSWNGTVIWSPQVRCRKASPRRSRCFAAPYPISDRRMRKSWLLNSRTSPIPLLPS